MLATWTRSSLPRALCRRAYATAPAPAPTPKPATAARKPPSRPLLGRYTDTLPCELARVQSGRNVRLRDYAEQRALGRVSYDLKLQDGKVLPAEGPNFIGPNGCSLRPPFSPTFQEVVRNFRGRDIVVSIVPEGTPLPPTLTVLHEHSDHYSMQCTKPMSLTELDEEITKFMNEHARTMDKFQFDEEYPFEI